VHDPGLWNMKRFILTGTPGCGKTSILHALEARIRNLGFCEPTPARQITYTDSLLFERIHQEAYLELGYTCVPVEPAPLGVRVEAILARLAGTETLGWKTT